ncbi:MAG: hypothetical protein AAF211_30535, partial [Myxococcota bacterium]
MTELDELWQNLSLTAHPGPSEPECTGRAPRSDGPGCIGERRTGGGSHSSSSSVTLFVPGATLSV